MKLFSICTIILFFYIAMDIIFDDELWQLNTQITLFLQENQFLGEKEMFAVFSYSLFVMPSIALIAFFFMDNKLGALLYGLMILMTIAINSLLKNIYHQPRPYFVEEDIEPYECNKEFGKPSGHAMCSSAMCFLLPSILFPAVWKDQQNCQYSKLVRIMVIFSITFWSFMTGFSRIFMGVHSIGQILLGWVYSAYIIIMYMAYCHDPIMNYIRIRLQPGSIRITNKDLMIVGLVCTVWTFVSILFFELNKRVFLSEKDVSSWLEALFEKCSNQMSIYTINSPPVLQNICFSLSLYVWIVFGFLLGIKLTNGVYFENQFSQNYSQLSILKKFLRVILLIALIATLVPFIILVKFDEVYLQAFLQIFIVSILGGLILTFFYSKLLHFFKLSVNGDFIQITQSFEQAPDGASFEMQSPKNV